ncbi:MAG TPA: hypothetical protein VMJ35_15725 [Dongiaceae bacterium]|nr:hypothetical protein [Dongiaceae bacterium]
MNIPKSTLGSKTRAKDALLKLLAYCRATDWAGYDPYDALNSRLFVAMPLLNSRWPRLILTQALKRSPVNLRRLLAVPKTQNPKGLALCLSAVLKLSQADVADRNNLVRYFIDRLDALRSAGSPYACWGYSFPWQTRKEVVPAGTPNLVCTVFVANALLGAYEQFADERCLAMAASAADYVANELYWTDGAGWHSFSYPLPSIRVQVHNANFLAAALLCRVAKLTGNSQHLSKALDVTRCSVSKQKQDGSWDYGEGPKQDWIDNFHTGFNLGALADIDHYTDSEEFAESIRRGFEFYRTHFFRDDGAPRYFHDRTYPIDIHCVAQSLITLTQFQHLDPSSALLAEKVAAWTLDHMWDKRGFFYYRVLRSITIRTPYMRWSEAWMLLALAVFTGDQTALKNSAHPATCSLVTSN